MKKANNKFDLAVNFCIMWGSSCLWKRWS